jgi:hypothetical protein
MKLARLIGLAVIIVWLTPYCEKPELTRDKAGTLIESAADFKTPQSKVALSDKGYSAGQLLGYWSTRGELSSKGRQFFSALSRRGSVTLNQPLNRAVVEVTGIADAVTPLAGQKGGSIKEAQFGWKYSNVPPEPKRVIAGGGTGTAIIRLFDDGWRIDSIEIRTSTDPIILSQEEEAAAESDRKAEVDRANAEREKWNSRIRNATTPTKQIYRYVDNDSIVVFSDVGIQVTLRAFPRYKIDTSYADVKDIGGSSNRTRFYIEWIESKPFPHSNYYGLATQISLKLKDLNERNRVFQIITSAYNDWKAKYPEFVGKGNLSRAMK